MNPSWIRRTLPAFGLGLLIGAAIGVHLWKWNPLHHRRGGDPTPRIVEKFGRELKLSQEQKVKLAIILEKTHEKMQKLQGKSCADFQVLQKETAASIEKILTPEQLPVFVRMEKKHLARLRGKGRGPVGPCPPNPARP